MSISRKLVARLGGSVDVERSLGEGSTCTIHLPQKAPYVRAS